MSRHRGAKPCRRYELLGKISLLSPAYLLSVERWPFHSGPPDHYSLLSHLLVVSDSQSSSLILLRSAADFQTAWGNLRTPPLRFRRRPPQSNYPPDIVFHPDHGCELEISVAQGGISTMAPSTLTSQFHSLPPILHSPTPTSMSRCSKGARGLSV